MCLELLMLTFMASLGLLLRLDFNWPNTAMKSNLRYGNSYDGPGSINKDSLNHNPDDQHQLIGVGC